MKKTLDDSCLKSVFFDIRISLNVLHIKQETNISINFLTAGEDEGEVNVPCLTSCTDTGGLRCQDFDAGLLEDLRRRGITDLNAESLKESLLTALLKDLVL